MLSCSDGIIKPFYFECYEHYGMSPIKRTKNTASLSPRLLMIGYEMGTGRIIPSGEESDKNVYRIPWLFHSFCLSMSAGNASHIPRLLDRTNSRSYAWNKLHEHHTVIIAWGRGSIILSIFFRREKAIVHRPAPRPLPHFAARDQSVCLARVQDMGAQPMNASAAMDTLEGMSKPCESLCFVSDGCSVRLAARSDGAVWSPAVREIALCSRLVRSTQYACTPHNAGSGRHR